MLFPAEAKRASTDVSPAPDSSPGCASENGACTTNGHAQVDFDTNNFGENYFGDFNEGLVALRKVRNIALGMGVPRLWACSRSLQMRSKESACVRACVCHFQV